MPNLPHVHYLAVLVSGIVIFMLGGLWYSALFAKPWMALMGKTEAELKEGSSAMPLLMGVAFLTGLFISWIMAIVINHFFPYSAIRGAFIGAFCWAGFAGSTSFSTALFSMQPKRLWMINSGFNLVSFVVAGVILSVWR